MMNRIISLFIIFVSTLLLCSNRAEGNSSPYTPKRESTWFVSGINPHSIFVDLSYLNDPPAGKHGFLRVEGDRFIFEDGSEIRFWGIVLNGDACFPDKAEALTLAKRLASLGFNLVRLKNLDAPWTERGLIDYRHWRDSRHLDYRNLDRLDYLIYVLKQEGIYIYLDLLTSRKFRELDGIRDAATLPYSGKGATLIDPRLIKLQKEYARQLWTHFNPYTELRYRDDPAIALTVLTDENDLTTHYFLTPERSSAHPELSKLFLNRLDEFAEFNKLSKSLTRGAVKTPEGRMALNDIMISYFYQMDRYLRGIGVKIPITATNWATNLHDLPALASMDFIDQHIYADGGLFKADFMTPPFREGTSLQRQSFARVEGVPFVVSEWNKEFPKEYRAEYPLTFAAVAAFQGWNGVILHSYASKRQVPPHLYHPMDVIVDPARIALLPAAAVIFRRAVNEAFDSSIIKISMHDIYSDNYIPDDMMAYRTGLWRKRLSLSWDDEREGVDPMHFFLPPDAKEARSRSEDMVWNWEDGYRIINTSLVQAFVGKGGGKKRRTDDAIFQIDNDFYAAAVVSLGSDDTPINSAEKIFVVVTGRVKNTNEIIDHSDGGRVVYTGEAPILSEVITGNIMIRHSAKEQKYRLKYSVLLPTGVERERGELERSADGWWILPILPEDRTHFYMISKKYFYDFQKK
jgi:hypothetical protein